MDFSTIAEKTNEYDEIAHFKKTIPSIKTVFPFLL